MCNGANNSGLSLTEHDYNESINGCIRPLISIVYGDESYCPFSVSVNQSCLQVFKLQSKNLSEIHQ